MADNEYISGVPNGITIGSVIAVVLGFIPIVNIFGAGIGGMAASYVEEYGIVKSFGAGIAVGIVSLIPLGLFFILSLGLGGGGAAADSTAMATLGGIGGFLGGIYGLISLFAAPAAGASGGLSLGIYFHLIHKASD